MMSGNDARHIVFPPIAPRQLSHKDHAATAARIASLVGGKRASFDAEVDAEVLLRAVPAVARAARIVGARDGREASATHALMQSLHWWWWASSGLHVIAPTHGLLASLVIAAWRERAAADWLREYGVAPRAWETLVGLPRSGACFRADGWRKVGYTAGLGARRPAGHGHAKRVIIRTTRKMILVRLA